MLAGSQVGNENCTFRYFIVGCLIRCSCSGQAMDIGAPAILFLIDAWEGHLTPPEAAGIADKVSIFLYLTIFFNFSVDFNDVSNVV